MIVMDDLVEEKKLQLREKSKKAKQATNNEDFDLTQIMMSPISGMQGNFVSDDKGEFEDSEIDYVQGRIQERLGKYKQEVVEDMIKNPDQYTLTTPEGEMTLEKAIAKGYNPKTGRFDLDPISLDFEDRLNELGDSDKEAIQKIFSPQNARIPPAEAAQYGIPENSQLLRQLAAQQNTNPAIAEQLGRMGTGVPANTAGSSNTPLDIQSLLGGGM